MSITVLNRPYDNLTTTRNITPVYNGLPFVTESTFKNKSSMRYIAEIFVNNIKIGELRHNPDISNDNKGMFNVGRIIEGYLGYNLNWNIQGGTLAPQSAVNYHVAFGEEFSRINRIKSITSYSGTWGSNRVKIRFEEPHNLLSSSKILIQGTTVTGLNTYHTVQPSTDIFTVVLPNSTFTTQGNISQAYAIEGEMIKNFTSYVGPDGATYVAIKVNANTKLNIGDMIQINQDVVAYTQYENIEWSVVNKIPVVNSLTTIQTNIPYAGPIPTTTLGSVISRDNYVLRDQWSTKNDLSQTFNGAIQYAEYLTWTPSPYLFISPTNKFLTDRPRKDINVCVSDWMTLSMFGKDNLPSSTSQPDYVMYEVWSNPPVSTFTPVSNTNVSALGDLRVKVVFSGNLTTNFTNGSYVTLYVGTTPYSRRVLQSTYLSGSNTTEVLFEYITILSPPTITSVVINIKVTLNNIVLPISRAEIPAGPKNLTTIPAINTGTAYKYFIYAYKKGTYWFQNEKKSETFTFNLSCNCSKFKKFNMMWLNPLGGWDYHIFDKRNDQVRKIEKQQFTRHLESYQGTNGGYKYKLGDRGRTTYNTMSTENYKLRTDFLSQDDINWLSYIYESPEVYWIDNDNNKIYPVTLKNEEANIWSKTNFNDTTGTLYTYEIDMELANDRVIQRGGNMYMKPGVTTTTGGGTTPNPGPWKPPYTGEWFNQYTYTKSLYE